MRDFRKYFRTPVDYTYTDILYECNLKDNKYIEFLSFKMLTTWPSGLRR